MNCRSVERLLSNDLEGRLSRRLKEAVSAHLLGCHRCRRLRDDILAAEQELLGLPDPMPPADIERRAVRLWMGPRARARLSWKRGKVLLWPGARPAWWSPLAAAVMVAVLLLAVLGLVLPASGNVSPGLSRRSLVVWIPAGSAGCCVLSAERPSDSAPSTQHPALRSQHRLDRGEV